MRMFRTRIVSEYSTRPVTTSAADSPKSGSSSENIASEGTEYSTVVIPRTGPASARHRRASRASGSATATPIATAAAVMAMC